MNSEASEACKVKTAKPTKKKREVPREYDIFVKNNWDKTKNFTDNSKKISELWKEKAKEKEKKESNVSE